MRTLLAMRPSLLLPLSLLALSAQADPIGEVDTVFQLIGSDHKIVVDAHDDPKVAGATRYVSRAKTGGIKGAVDLAENKCSGSQILTMVLADRVNDE